MILGGLMYLGGSLDFISILLTNHHFDNSNAIIGILSYMWQGPFIIVTIYIASDLIIPKKKRIITIPYIGFAAIYEVFVFLDPINTYEFVLPEVSGEDLINPSLIPNTPLFFLMMVFLLSILLTAGSYLFKALSSKENMRKKLSFLSIGYFIFVFVGAIDSLMQPSFTLFLLRMVVLVIPLFFYLALREEPIKREKKEYKKEIQVEGDLFRFSQIRRENITEEEISISREKKICLVCKSKTSKFIYICPGCDAFYCTKCTQALIEMENACWVCNTPFDETKPSKPYEKQDQKIEIKESLSKKKNNRKYD